MSYGLAVDLGTTFTSAAIAEDDKVESVTLESHETLIPSAVHLASDGRWTVGVTALRRAEDEPDGLARAFKRSFGDPVPQILAGEPVSVEQLTARLLAWVVERVTERKGESPHTVVVTHPAHWSQSQRSLLRGACEPVVAPARLSLLTEPEAIALHTTSQSGAPAGRLAVYDFGGGTFDATILEVSDTGFSILGDPVGLATAGGIDLDDLVFQWALDQLEPGVLERLDRADPLVLDGLRRLRERAVEAKEALSTETDAAVSIELPTTRQRLRLPRSEFEAMARPLIVSTIEAVEEASKRAGVPVESLDRIVLAGGSSQVPLVVELVADRLGVPADSGMHPKLTVALGAATTLIPPSRRSVPKQTVVEATSEQAPPEPFDSRAAASSPDLESAVRSDDRRSGSRSIMAIAGAAVVVIAAAAGWFAFAGDDGGLEANGVGSPSATTDEGEPLGPTVPPSIDGESSASSAPADSTVRDAIELLRQPSPSTVSPPIDFLSLMLPGGSQGGYFYFTDCRDKLDELDQKPAIGPDFVNLLRELDRYPPSGSPDYVPPGDSTSSIAGRLRNGVERTRNGYELCDSTSDTKVVGTRVLASWAATHAFLCASLGAPYGPISLIENTHGLACPPPDNELATCVRLLTPYLETFFSVGGGGSAPDPERTCIAAMEDDDIAFEELEEESAFPS